MSFVSMALEYLGYAWNYGIAAVLILGGGYLAFVLGSNPLNPLAKLFHFAGTAAMIFGACIAAATYFKSVGAAECQASWEKANLHAQIDKLAREAAIQKANAALQEQRANQREAELDETTKRANEYAATLANNPVCGLTADDLRQLRAIR